MDKLVDEEVRGVRGLGWASYRQNQTSIPYIMQGIVLNPLPTTRFSSAATIHYSIRVNCHHNSFVFQSSQKVC